MSLSGRDLPVLFNANSCFVNASLSHISNTGIIDVHEIYTVLFPSPGG